MIIKKNDLELFLKNSRFLYAKTPLYKLGNTRAAKEWNKKTGKVFPFGQSTSYNKIFIDKVPPTTLTLSTASLAIETLNPYLLSPYEGTPEACFEKFIQYEFTEDRSPALNVNTTEKFLEKYIQDYYIYTISSKKHELEVGILSLHKDKSGKLKAYMICQFGNMSEIFNKEKIWGIFKDFDDKEIGKRFQERYINHNGAQPICRLFYSEQVTFTKDHLKIIFKADGEPECQSFLFLDISDTSLMPYDLYYQFGCGTLTTLYNSPIGFKASHILLVTATDGTYARTYNFQGKRPPKYPECQLDPIGFTRINDAIEYCNLDSITCNVQQSKEFYNWTKRRNIEELRAKQQEESELSKADIAELISKLQNIYEKME